VTIAFAHTFKFNIHYEDATHSIMCRDYRRLGPRLLPSLNVPHGWCEHQHGYETFGERRPSLLRISKRMMRNLSCNRLQIEEIWASCHWKEKNVPAERRDGRVAGVEVLQNPE
jgi:hypothetical protein